MGKQVRKQKKSSIVAGGFLRFGLYVCVIIAVVYIGKSAFDFGYAIFNQVPMASEEDGRDITVVVEDGDSVYQIGKTLKNKGLIEDAKIFVIQEKLSNYKGKLQAGTYILNTSMNVEEMMAVLARENTEGQPDQTNPAGETKEGSSDLTDGAKEGSTHQQEGQDEGGEQQ